MKKDSALQIYIDLLKERSPRPLTINEMNKLLGISSYNKKAIRAGLDAAIRGGALRSIGKSRYQWLPAEKTKGQQPKAAPRERAQKAPRVEGLYSRVRAGFGFVDVLGPEADKFSRDILIPEGMEGQAMHGDRVEVEIVRIEKRSERVVGRISNVVESPHEKVIGILENYHGSWRVLPQNELIPPVLIESGAKPSRDDEGLIGIARLTRRPEPHKLPAGELIEVVGSPDNPNVQFLSIVLEHGLRHEFPPEALAEAARLPEDPTPEEFKNREDLRRLPFVTIDGESARDFDDAVYLEPIKGGGWRLRVAIADVSHYVKEGSAIGDEALERATSTYFPDRAIPMLPEALSNGLCSLRPHVPRLSMVAEIELDAGGGRVDSRFYRAVIESHARLTYTQVAAMLSETKTPELDAEREKLGEILEMLRDMRELMRTLYKRRVKRGSLDLDLPEALLDLSEEGRAVGLRLSTRNDAHRMVEEFMLEANKAVASHLGERKIPLAYRIHEPPDPSDVDELNTALEPYGLGVDYDIPVKPINYQALLKALSEHRLSRPLSRMVLRSLKQAQYSPSNHGHFGLGFADYCHFTSPIRRYPDLIVHRQLGRVIDGKFDQALEAAESVAADCAHSSQREREAMDAERAMVDLKKAEFMLGHLLEEEEGTIVSVTSFGFFVELDAYPVEGLVHVESLGEEDLFFDDVQRVLGNPRSGLSFRLGDRVRVMATNVSLQKRQINFELIERLSQAITGGAPLNLRPRGARKSGKPDKSGKPSDKSRDKRKNKQKPEKAPIRKKSRKDKAQRDRKSKKKGGKRR